MPVKLPPMSCLFAACVPGMLMVTTFGLQRLESVLHRERPSAAQIVGRIENAARNAQIRAIGNGPVAGPTVLPERRPDPVHRLLADEPGLPTRIYLSSPANPRFQPAEFANSV